MNLKQLSLPLILIGSCVVTPNATAGSWVYGQNATMEISVTNPITFNASSTNWTINRQTTATDPLVAQLTGTTNSPVSAIGFKWQVPGASPDTTTMVSGTDQVEVKLVNTNGSAPSMNPDGYFVPTDFTGTTAHLNVNVTTLAPVAAGTYTTLATAAYYL